MGNAVGKPARASSWASPPFVACVIILTFSAVGLRPLVGMLKDRYRKESIDIRLPLQRFDVSRLPSFRQSRDASAFFLEEASDEARGTAEYVSLSLQEKEPADAAGHAFLFVTYYSDPKDKVPHTPEVCYRQVGTVIRDIQTVTVDTPALMPEHASIRARLLAVEQSNTNGVIAYCFCVNGEFYFDRNQVRWAISCPGDKYIYFSKIEAAAPYDAGEDPEPALQLAKKLLSEALPVLLSEHYPKTADLNPNRPPHSTPRP